MRYCPHGVPHPFTAADMGKPAGPTRDSEQVARVVVVTSRDCPGCLRSQLTEANALIKKVFEINRPGLDADTYALWIKYVQRYDP